MIQLHYPLYLCSKSPRRLKLLQAAGVPCQVFEVETDESFTPSENIADIPSQIAEQKWQAASKLITQSSIVILTADTMVFLDRNPLGKPKDREEAQFFLNSLSNRTHQVVTAFCLGLNSQPKSSHTLAVTSHVTFKPLDPQVIENYIETGSPFDKAGGYGIQDDLGANFIQKIEGSLNNVIGLPVDEVIHSLVTHQWASITGP